MHIIQANLELIFQHFLSREIIDSRCQLKGSNLQFRQQTTQPTWPKKEIKATNKPTIKKKKEIFFTPKQLNPSSQF